MNMLHCLTEDMNLFRELVTSNMSSIMRSLNESNMPKKVFKPDLEINLIEHCLWVLHKNFKFAKMAKLKVSCYTH
jgi:hypothetical protein